MFLAAAFIGRGKIAVEHELDVVLAVGDAHVDPTEHGSFGAAAPELAEAEEVAVEGDGFCAVADEKAEMIDGVGDAADGQELASVFGFYAIGLRFDELDEIAVGVFDLEVEIAGAAFADLRADWNAA